MSVCINNLTVIMQKEIILDNIDLEIEDGEFLALIGPSGGGKSTLLKSIAGLQEIASGTILIDGKDMTQMPPEKRGAVIVFQDLRLFPHMTVARNVGFALEVKGLSKSEREKSVAKLLAEVQLSGLEKRRVREISGGQAQRVALARALAAEPKVLLLDEPFSSLDENLRKEMGDLVRRLHDNHGFSTIMVTHDQAEALALGDRVSIMHTGHLTEG